MKKTFVLDANVLLHDPQSISSFQDNDVVIILSVLSEIDSFKKNLGEIGVNAREVARELDRLSKIANLSQGVDIANGGKLFVYAHHSVPLPDDIKHNVDARIISETSYLRGQGQNAIIVSKDTILRVIANSIGISAEDYKSDSKYNEMYSGIRRLSVDKDVFCKFSTEGVITIDGYGGVPNEYVHMTLDTDDKKSLLGRARADGSITIIYNKNHNMFNVKPRNMEQIFAADALLDDSIKLVTLGGRAGTGKTLLAVAAALVKLHSETFARIVITRPTIPVGRDIGFLPGDMDEKMLPWMQPIYDAIDMIREVDRTSSSGSSISSKLKIEELINIAPLTYLRGRSIPHSFMIVDECQNLTPKEVKTLVTRCGEGTKMVFTGDVDQIDDPFLDRVSNGFTYLVSKFKSYDIHAHVQLCKGERSRLAQIAADIL